MRQITVLVLAFACFGAFLRNGRSQRTFETDGGENSQLENVIVGGNDMDDDFNDKEDPINDVDKAEDEEDGQEMDSELEDGDSSMVPLHNSNDEKASQKRSPLPWRRRRFRIRIRLRRVRIRRRKINKLCRYIRNKQGIVKWVCNIGR